MRRASALRDFVQDPVHVVGSDTARYALATGFAHAEIHEEAGHIDHAGSVVHDNHAARTHNRAGAREIFVVDRHIEKLLGQTSARGTAGLDGFELAALRHASTDVEDHLAQRGAHGHFDEAGVVDAAGEREDLGALALFGADLRVPFAAIA